MIPAQIQKKLGFRDGKEFVVLEEDGIVKLIPLYDIGEDQDWVLDTSELIKNMQADRASEIEVENRKFHEVVNEWNKMS